MLEMLISPQKAERKPWELFFIGIFYASISILLVNWIFVQDPVLSTRSGILVVTFTVMFSLPFMYYVIKLEENKATQHMGALRLLREHRKAIWAFLWLFMGFVVGFSFWYIILPTTTSFQEQIETFCAINSPDNFGGCVQKFGVKGTSAPTAFLSNKERLFLIFSNNIYVLIFTLIFSLIFGAGAIFILAWNASVIAAAISIFTQSNLNILPLALFRYMIHGLPEIAAYFVGALAGGIISIAVIRHEMGTDRFWSVLQDSLNLIILSVVLLFVASILEVFITPIFF
ncbi:MAG: stage II sporulation protein M [Nanoarchaeota archaeon]|nr:stage II sporulation protein M [Nanoarchaeota archaeon]